MAITHEHVACWTTGELTREIANRVELGLPTLVLDRRIAPDEIPTDDLQLDGPGSTLDLADAGRWLALIVPALESLSQDLESFARALSIWCRPSTAPVPEPIPNIDNATERLRIATIIKALYDEDVEEVVRSIGDETVRHWRSALRDLGEGPRAVVDDPWFSHLFLSPTAAELPLARPYTRVDLRSPRVPRRAAQRIAAVVLDRLLSRAENRGQGAAEPEVLCFILEGPDLELGRFQELSENSASSSALNLRIIWIEEVKDDAGTTNVPSGEGDVSPRSDDDSKLYFMFSTSMDKRHRGLYVKGIMYGYTPFCVIDKPDEMPDDLVFLQKAGIELGMSSPLVELFDD